MASKETSAAGFVNVSREITGELGHEFVEEVCLNLSLNPPEKRGEQLLRSAGLVFITHLLFKSPLSMAFDFK